MDETYENTNEYNLNKKRKILIVFQDMIAGMLNNNKINPINIFIRGRKLKIYQTKFYSLFYHENSKQKGASTNHNYSSDKRAL